MEPPGIAESEKFANANYSSIQIVVRFMADRSKAIEGVFPIKDKTHRDEAIRGLWFRAFAWMRSIEQLNGAGHFQAISAGLRALLEIAVDLILLHHDKTNGLGWKIQQWGTSERMKAAEQLVRFYHAK